MQHGLKPHRPKQGGPEASHARILQVMTQLAEQIANMRRPASAREEAVTALTLMEGSPAPEGSGDAVAALLGDPRDQLAFTIFSVLPWLCVHFRHSSHTATAGACTRVSSACPLWAAMQHAPAWPGSQWSPWSWAVSAWPCAGPPYP